MTGRRPVDDRGVSTIELLLLTPLLVLALLGVLQVALVAQADQSAQDAALAAARADRLGRDPATAANQAATPRLRPVRVSPSSGSPHAWAVEIDVPVVFPGADVTVHGTARLP